jgi:hypothetical protein
MNGKARRKAQYRVRDTANPCRLRARRPVLIKGNRCTTRHNRLASAAFVNGHPDPLGRPQQELSGRFVLLAR